MRGREHASTQIQGWFQRTPGFERARAHARHRRRGRAADKIGGWFRSTPSFAPARKRARQKTRHGGQLVVAGMQVGFGSELQRFLESGKSNFTDRATGYEQNEL